MSTADFLILWLVSFSVIFACRVLPPLVLRGRALSPRVVEALGYIPPAAFAALVANDLISPGDVSASGPLAAAVPWGCALLVALLARKTGSMLVCCAAGTVCFALLNALF